MAETDGDDNDNTINGTTGNDNIEGNGGADEIDGRGGKDTISGGSGNDTIDGGAGDDTIYGGDGDDVITGGSGDDVIVGGRGDDTLSAGSGSRTDTYVIRDGDGNDTITDFDPSEPDIIKFDMVEITSYQDVLDRITMDGSDTIITYDNGSTTRLQNTDFGDLSSTNFEFGSGPVCLGAGTLIETPTGRIRIEALNVGDWIMTLDHGPQRVVQLIQETIRFQSTNDRRKPVLISKGALGEMKPDVDTVVSPQHRFLQQCSRTGQDLLVAAIKMTKRKGVRRMQGRKDATYYNLLMSQHEIIFANGCAVETLLLTPYSALKIAALNDGSEFNYKKMTSARPIAERDPLFAKTHQINAISMM